MRAVSGPSTRVAPALGAPAGHREAWLEIDLAAIAHNVACIRAAVGPGVSVAPVVKANAYGHGLAAVARSLDGRVDALCVATLDEGLELRRVGARGRVIVLYPVPAAGLPEALRAGLELVVMEGGDARAIVAAAAGPAAPAGPAAGAVEVHLAGETGMARGGVAPARVAEVARTLLAAPSVTLAGVWTHLHSPEDAARSAAQVAAFREALAGLERAGLARPPAHVGASGGIFAGTAPVLDMVRPGLAVYGALDPGLPIAADRASAAVSLRPAMSLKARPVAFSDVPAGGTVGYGGTWRATRPSRVAILPLGYGDGFARASAPGAWALVRGRRAPLVGVISMDALAVDVSDVPGVDERDELVLLGGAGDDRITVADLARTRNTIAWEVLSGMAARLTRVYDPPAGVGEPESSPGPP